MSPIFGKNISGQETISLFEQEIARQQDIIYGVALFFECLSLLHADRPCIVETSRKQFRNIIQKGTEMTRHASKMLEEARKHPGKNMHLIEHFKFTECEGHPNPAEMAGRARRLVEIYNRIFPDRPRSKDFTSEETMKLIEAGSETFTAQVTA